MMKIQPQYLTLDDLLKKRLFRIPRYQRAYSWQKKQRADLFQDIREVAARPELTHFMATVVALRRDRKQILTDEFAVLDIVDGQQRLTTLIILLKCIELALQLSDDKNERTLAGGIHEYLIKQDQASLLLLQSNHDYRGFYHDFIRNGTIPAADQARTLADRAMANAIADCVKFVEEFDGRLMALTALLKNRLAFILHEIDDEAAVYTVFEVLNSRGLSVPWLDRLKSMLMAVAFEDASGNRNEHIDELHEIWARIYQCVGLRQGLGAEVVRFAATLETSRSRSRVFGEEDAAEELRRLAADSAGAISVSLWIEKVARAVDGLLVQRRRSAVTGIAHARLLAVAVSLASYKTDDQDQILEQWERVTFRVFGMARRDARTGVGDYVRLAQGVYRGEQSSTLLDKLRKIGAGQFSGANVVKGLQNANCYEGWEEALRYFMFAYEEHLATNAGQTFSNEQWNRIWEASASKSIEHIYPQSRGATGPSDTDIFVHRLGNLMLLPPGLNSQLQDKLPTEKIESYRNTGLLAAIEVAETKGHWDRDAIEKREARLLEWAQKRWADL